MNDHSYVLSCCSTADLEASHFSRRDISWIPFHFMLGDRSYPDDLGGSISFPDFYAAMAEGKMTSTSQVSVGEFVEYFTPFLEAGKDILHVSLSSGLSGVYNAARLAREELAAKYPGRQILLVDSLGASSGYGLLMDRLADLRDEGMDVKACWEWAMEHRLDVHHWFFSTTLEYYIRGGRISRSAGFFGKMLGICPLLNMNDEGKLTPREKIRTKRRVIAAIVDRMAENCEDGLDYSGKCYISMSACMEDAKQVAELVEKRFPRLNGKVEINWIGTTIGSHTGPGTVALFFWGKKRGK